MDLEKLRALAMQIAVRFKKPSLVDEVLSELVTITLTSSDQDLYSKPISQLTRIIAKSIFEERHPTEMVDSGFERWGEPYSIIDHTMSDSMNPEEAFCEAQSPTPEPCLIEADPMDDPLLSWDEEQAMLAKAQYGITWAEISKHTGFARATIWRRIKRAKSNLRPSESKRLLENMVVVNWLVI